MVQAPNRKSGFKQRLVTAVALIALFALAVLGLPTAALAALFAIIVLLAAYEWARLARLRSVLGQWLYLVGIAAALAGAWLLLREGEVLRLLLPALLFWLLATLALRWIAPESRERASGDPARGERPLLLGAGLLALAPAWGALVFLHGLPSGAQWVLYVLGLVWVVDIAAYLAGRRFGRAKLAPRLSPGKTWVGFYAGIAAAALYGAAGSRWLAQDFWLLAVSVLAALASVVGDLFESLIKRRAGVKDSGGLLPGHGGVLDRIDSLTAAAPVFALGMLWMAT